MTSPPSEREKKSERERGRGRGREGGSHVVNTCSLRGDWSTANLFTYRLTTQEPLFLPLPSHPPFIPCYLTFPSLASSASRLPSSPPPSTFVLPFLSLLKLPKSLPPIFSPMFLLLPPPTTLNCHSCPPPPLCLLLTNIYPSVPSPRLSKHFLPASSLHHSILHPSPDLPV